MHRNCIHKDNDDDPHSQQRTSGYAHMYVYMYVYIIIRTPPAVNEIVNCKYRSKSLEDTYVITVLLQVTELDVNLCINAHA